MGSDGLWKMHFVFNQLCLLRGAAGSGCGMLWRYLVTQTEFEEHVAHRAFNAQVQHCEHGPADSSSSVEIPKQEALLVCAGHLVRVIV